MARKKKKTPTISTVEVYRKTRRTWAINPVTKVTDTEKGYKRARAKKDVRQRIEREDA
jgi:hypothetical protein